VTRYSPDEVDVSVPAGSAGGLLMLTDQWYPGWTATVDGRPTTILRADVALRGVAIGPGAHRIRFVYNPPWPLQGLAIVVFTVVLLGLLGCASAGRIDRAPITKPS
jgi:uncharacterized membrane protein YfhO